MPNYCTIRNVICNNNNIYIISKILISKLKPSKNNKEDEINYDIIKMCIIFVISKINYELVL